jgi:hypothetical protein
MARKIDKDYHIADARNGIKNGKRYWYAFCNACQYRGPIRKTKSAAEDDALAHDTAENG